MKRKLVQVEMDDGASPSKLFQVPSCRSMADMPLLDTSPPFGRPNLASTPVITNKKCAQVRNPLQQQQKPAASPEFDPSAEDELRRIVNNFVSIYEQLDTCEGTDVKPNYSYTELAYLAMLRAPNFCLPINEIYRYISSRFLFFKHSTRKHWRNAVRHSLAKTLCFTKIPVGRGKSNSENLARSMYLWCILPSSISSFARGDYRPCVDKDSGTNTLRWGYYHMNAGKFWDQVGNYIANKMTTFRRTLELSSTPGLIFESQVCSLPGANQHLLGANQHLARANHHLPGTSQHLSGANQHLLGTNQHLPGANHHMPGTSQHLSGANQHLTNNRLPHHEDMDRSQGYSVSRESVQYACSQVGMHQVDNVEETVSVLASSSPLAYGPTDPWLVTVSSPNVSLCSDDSDRRTSPYLSFDSGNDTYESSPEKSSCRFTNPCAVQNQQNHTLHSPNVSKGERSVRLSSPLSSFQINSFDDSGFNTLELSALGDADFLQNQCLTLDQLRYIPDGMSDTFTFSAPVNYSVEAASRLPNGHSYKEACCGNFLPICSTVNAHLPNSSPFVPSTLPFGW